MDSRKIESRSRASDHALRVLRCARPSKLGSDGICILRGKGHEVSYRALKSTLALIAALGSLTAVGCGTTAEEVGLQPPDFAVPDVNLEVDEVDVDEPEGSDKLVEADSASLYATDQSSYSSEPSIDNSGKPSASCHEHEWVAQTAQKWVVDSEAWDETVISGEYIQCSCELVFNTQGEWSAHNKPIMVNTGTGHSYSVKASYSTVHHDVVGHYETETTGYACSCGAAKPVD